MKKMLTALAVVIVLFSTAVLAEDLSAGTDHQDLFRFALLNTPGLADTPFAVILGGGLFVLLIFPPKLFSLKCLTFYL